MPHTHNPSTSSSVNNNRPAPSQEEIEAEIYNNTVLQPHSVHRRSSAPPGSERLVVTSELHPFWHTKRGLAIVVLIVLALVGGIVGGVVGGRTNSKGPPPPASSDSPIDVDVAATTSSGTLKDISSTTSTISGTSTVGVQTLVARQVFYGNDINNNDKVPSNEHIRIIPSRQRPQVAASL